MPLLPVIADFVNVPAVDTTAFVTRTSAQTITGTKKYANIYVPITDTSEPIQTATFGWNDSQFGAHEYVLSAFNGGGNVLTLWNTHAAGFSALTVRRPGASNLEVGAFGSSYGAGAAFGSDLFIETSKLNGVASPFAIWETTDNGAGTISNRRFTVVPNGDVSIWQEIRYQDAQVVAFSVSKTGLTTIPNVAIATGTVAGLTSFGIRSTGTGAFDLTLANSENLTASRALTLKVNNAARTVDLAGNLTLAAAFATSGANALTLTTTGATNVTLPTSGTLVAAGAATGSGLTMSTAKILGRATASTGAIEEISVTGTGNAVLSAAPTFTGNSTFAQATFPNGYQNSIIINGSGSNKGYISMGNDDQMYFSVPGTGAAMVIYSDGSPGNSGSGCRFGIYGSSLSSTTNLTIYTTNVDLKVSGTRYFDVAFTTPGETTVSTGHLAIATVGKTLRVKSGTNAKAGTFTLTAGAATVSNTSVTANSVIVFSLTTVGGTLASAPYVSALTAGTSFAVAGGGVANTSTYNYIIMEVN